jgi:hypothetical protein
MKHRHKNSGKVIIPNSPGIIGIITRRQGGRGLGPVIFPRALYIYRAQDYHHSVPGNRITRPVPPEAERVCNRLQFRLPQQTKHGSCPRCLRAWIFGSADMCLALHTVIMATTWQQPAPWFPFHMGNGSIAHGLPSQCSWSCAPVTVPARQSGAYEFNDLCLFVGLSGTESKIGIWGVFPMKVQNRLAKKNIKKFKNRESLNEAVHWSTRSSSSSSRS